MIARKRAVLSRAASGAGRRVSSRRGRLALLVMILLLAGLRLLMPEPLHWALAPGQRVEPLAGLYPPEREPDGRSYRWTSGSGRLAVPAVSRGTLLLSVAAPHWQPSTPVRIGLGTSVISFSLAPGPHQVRLLAPPTAGRELLLAAHASRPPGGQRLLGLKLYRVAMDGAAAWSAANAALLLAMAFAVGLAAQRMRRPLWALLAVLPWLLPAALLIPLLPWLAFSSGLWVLAVVLQMRERYALALSAAAALAYVAGSPFTLSTTNDGSHYALIRAVGDEQQLSIDSFVGYAGKRDVAWRAGHYYSDRPPGTALLSLPLYLAARQAGAEHGQYPALAALLIQNALLGAAAVGLLYQICRELGRTRGAALFAAAAFGLGSIHWKYSGVLYAHALGALLSTLALWLALRTSSRWGSLLLGGVIGYGVAVEYTTVLLVPPLLLPLLWRRRSLLGWALGGLALGGLPLICYNLAAFGHPLHTGYTYHATFDWARNMGGTFVYPLFAGLWRLLFDNGDMIQGLLLLTPVYLLALPGVVSAWRARRRTALLWLLLVLPTLLLISTHRTFFGGSDRDPRYLAAILPFVALPLAYLWDQLRQWSRPSRLAGQLLCGLLLALSLLNQLNHLAYTNAHAIVAFDGPHAVWSWRYSWHEFWWAALPGHERALYLLLGMLAAGLVLSLPALRKNAGPSAGASGQPEAEQSSGRIRRAARTSR